MIDSAETLMPEDGLPLRFSIRTLGCKVNQVESDSVSGTLSSAGWLPSDPEDADVIVINTCTVTGEADRKARKLVRASLDAPGKPLVIVTGCVTGVDPASMQALGARVLIEPDKTRIPARVARVFGRTLPETPIGSPRALTRTRVAVKVEDGCDVFCAYCIVPHARGVPRSVPVTDVVTQVAELVGAGVTEVVLTGINIGRYDDRGTDLAGLVHSVGETGIARLRLSSVEPQFLTEDVLASFASTSGFMPHLHIPLQTGSDRLLSAMGRRYDAATFERLASCARDAIPGLALTTDVIAGLPGETAEDAESTVTFIDRVGFDRLHVFRYSPRAGTAAAEMPDQVPPAEKAARAERLRELDSRLRERHARRRLGTTASVLVESVDGGIAEGTSEDYLRVRFPTDDATVGSVVHVRVSALSDEGEVFGERHGAEGPSGPGHDRMDDGRSAGTER